LDRHCAGLNSLDTQVFWSTLVSVLSVCAMGSFRPARRCWWPASIWAVTVLLCWPLASTNAVEPATDDQQLSCSTDANTESIAEAYDACVLGAGAGGVQIGHYLMKLVDEGVLHNYTVFEKADRAGAVRSVSCGGF